MPVCTYKPFVYLEAGRRLMEYRYKHGLSQDNMAEILGCSQAFVSRIENGLKFLSAKHLKKFREYFDEEFIL